MLLQKLTIMVAVMDDPWVEQWAMPFGLIRRPATPWEDGESMSEFRARAIDTISKNFSSETAETLALVALEDGKEIDVTTGYVVE